MHAQVRPLLLALVVLAAGLAGCAGGGGSESTDTGNGSQNGTNGTNGTVTTPPTTTTTGSRAHFQVGEIQFYAPDGKARALYEDDANATIRYTVSQPSDAPAETAFVTYLLNGRILDIQQIRLEPGQSRDYTRQVDGLRENRTLKVEVRAGSAVARNETEVRSWPRAGADALQVGSVTVRADFGYLEQDGKVRVNLTLINDGTTEVDDFRVKMLCVDATGEVRTTRSYDVDAPTPGNRTGVDVLVDPCPADETIYGLEVKGKDDTGDLWGRLLFVEKGWRPTQASGTA